MLDLPGVPGNVWTFGSVMQNMSPVRHADVASFTLNSA